jgi:hypothetical protein
MITLSCDGKMTNARASADAQPQRDNEQYSDEEAQRRFLAAVKAGLNTKPKPLKSMTPKGIPA